MQASRWQRIGLQRAPVALIWMPALLVGLAAATALILVAGIALGAVVGRPSGRSPAATWGPCGWRRRGGSPRR
jgi:hypothetical protein